MFLFLPAVIVTFHWVLSGSQLPSAHPTAADYRGLADEYVRAEKFDKASEAFARASELYAKLGDLNASVILLGQSKRYRTDVDLYVEQPGGNDSAKQNFTAAKFEPMLGCFTGVNIEREDITRDPVKFDAIVRKPQAMFFMYRSYGMPFPTEFAKRLKSVHAGLQIAYEPKSIGAVVDDAYLRGFAYDAYKSRIPVFLRLPRSGGVTLVNGSRGQPTRNGFRNRKRHRSYW